MNQPQQAVSPDSVERVLRDVFGAPEYDWMAVRDPWAWVRNLYLDLINWFATLNHEHPVVYWMLMAVMLVVLTAILVHFSYLIFRALRPRTAAPELAGGRRRVVKDAAWYLREAHRLEDTGNLLRSLVMRFSALVIELDRRNVVRFNPSKTPIEYVREAAVPTATRDQFRALVAGVYRHVYGGEPVTPDRLRDFDRVAGLLVASDVA